MQIDLRLPENKRSPPGAKRNRRHAKNGLIERNRCIYVSHGQYEVIETLNLHRDS